MVSFHGATGQKRAAEMFTCQGSDQHQMSTSKRPPCITPSHLQSFCCPNAGESSDEKANDLLLKGKVALGEFGT